ncbi:Short-chain-enoyl-CoA hydratase [invertebrate metagenome]|uniref:Short-chain-enoyl-CoA hydratase n=1 Tax=invertebrate metagenome TaxID=1711999 RepID=A0A2H9T783_9ZZZZ
MEYQSIQLHLKNQIAYISLNRPAKKNAMNLVFWQEFPHALRAIEEEALAKVVIIDGEGDMFSAGMDVTVFAQPNRLFGKGEPGRQKENLRRTVLQLQAIFTLLEQSRIPVLVGIHGGCIGGALDLVCACDCRYATKDAWFSIQETRLGMTADLGTLQRLPYLIPNGLLRELAYTGRKLSAKEALHYGLVNQVFTDKPQMMDYINHIAQQILDNSPLAVAGSKEMINYARDHSVIDGLRYTATWQSGMFQAGEIMKAFQYQQQKKSDKNTRIEHEPLWPVTPPLE